MTPVRVAQTRAIPISVDEAYRATLPIDLTLLLHRWYGPLPPIKAVRDQDGAWGTVGQTRTIALTGGGTMREELTAVDAPGSFDYRITGITGALAPLVGSVQGRWAFAPSGTGTAVTWSWTLHPRSALTRPAVALIGRFWNGYARGALATLSDLIVVSPAG